MHCADGVHCVSTANGLRSRFTDAQRTDLALGNQLGQGSPRLLDRHIRIDSMLVVQVDVVGSERRQGSITAGPHVFRGAVDTDLLARVVDLDTEFGRDDHLIANRGKGLPNKSLVGGVTAVHIRSVKERDAQAQGGLNRAHAGMGVRLPIGCAHSHASQPLI